jgi:hypothetical protein
MQVHTYKSNARVERRKDDFDRSNVGFRVFWHYVDEADGLSYLNLMQSSLLKAIVARSLDGIALIQDHLIHPWWRARAPS